MALPASTLHARPAAMHLLPLRLGLSHPLRLHWQSLMKHLQAFARVAHRLDTPRVEILVIVVAFGTSRFSSHRDLAPGVAILVTVIASDARVFVGALGVAILVTLVACGPSCPIRGVRVTAKDCPQLVLRATQSRKSLSENVFCCCSPCLAVPLTPAAFSLGASCWYAVTALDG